MGTNWRAAAIVDAALEQRARRDLPVARPAREQEHLLHDHRELVPGEDARLEPVAIEEAQLAPEADDRRAGDGRPAVSRDGAPQPAADDHVESAEIHDPEIARIVHVQAGVEVVRPDSEVELGNTLGHHEARPPVSRERSARGGAAKGSWDLRFLPSCLWDSARRIAAQSTCRNVEARWNHPPAATINAY